MKRPLRATLLELARTDQQARRSRKKSFTRVDRNNTIVLRKIVRSFGWPTIAMVGREAAMAAWLIAQHADHDPDFQAECLRMLRAAARRGQADRVYVPYLTDRVLVNQGKRQVYGTQFFVDRKGRFVPRPIKDKSSLSARRSKYKLGSFTAYYKRLAARQEQIASVDTRRKKPTKRDVS